MRQEQTRREKKRGDASRGEAMRGEKRIRGDHVAASQALTSPDLSPEDVRGAELASGRRDRSQLSRRAGRLGLCWPPSLGTLRPTRGYSCGLDRSVGLGCWGGGRRLLLLWYPKVCVCV